MPTSGRHHNDRFIAHNLFIVVDQDRLHSLFTVADTKLSFRVESTRIHVAVFGEEEAKSGSHRYSHGGRADQGQMRMFMCVLRGCSCACSWTHTCIYICEHVCAYAGAHTHEVVR